MADRTFRLVTQTETLAAMRRQEKRLLAGVTSRVSANKRGTLSMAIASAGVIDTGDGSDLGRLCIHKVCRAASSVDLLVQKQNFRTGQWMSVTERSHPAFALVTAPNPDQSREDFVYRALIEIQRHGRCFITVWRDEAGQATDLVVAPYSIVEREEVARDGGIVIEYTVNWPSPVGAVTYSQEDVIDWHIPAIDDPSVGQGPWQLSESESAIEKEARDWQATSFRHRLIPDAILALPKGAGQESIESVKEQVKKNEGHEKARSVIVTSGEVTWSQVSGSSSEADFIETRKFTREQICAYYGVPPMIAGFMENATLSNFETARLLFMEETVIPLVAGLYASIARWLNQEISDYVRIIPNTQEVAALRARVAEKSSTAKDYHSMGVPFSVINERMGLGFPEFDSSEEGFLPANMVPAADVASALGGGDLFGSPSVTDGDE